MRHLAPTLLTLLTLALAACGAEPGGTDSTHSDEPPGVAGIYAMDVAKTTGGRVTDADGQEITVPDDVMKKVQSSHSQSDFRLELRKDGTFELFVEMGDDDFRTGGVWKETATGVELTTTTVNGVAATKEESLTETYVREGSYLVVEQGGQRVYMKRQPSE